jgi:hypothetical protein
MPEYDNTNSGTLFRNDRRTNDRQPTHTGSINVEGKDYWLSAWVKESKKNPGQKFFSLALTAKEDFASQSPAAGSGSYDEDVPF